MLSRKEKLPNKLQWQYWIDKVWFYFKIFFALCVFGMITFGWGTFYPNRSTIAIVNTELDKYYVDTIKEMDLQEPEFISMILNL